MEKKIVPARIEDAVLVKNIDDVSFEEIFHENLKYYEQCFENGYDIYLLMVEGIVAGEVILRKDDDDTIGIESIAIVPSFQKMGLSKFLLDFVELYSNNYKKIILEVYVHNKKAIDIYLKKGYSYAGVVKNFYAEGYDSFIMEKTL